MPTDQPDTTGGRVQPTPTATATPCPTKASSAASTPPAPATKRRARIAVLVGLLAVAVGLVAVLVSQAEAEPEADTAAPPPAAVPAASTSDFVGPVAPTSDFIGPVVPTPTDFIGPVVPTAPSAGPGVTAVPPIVIDPSQTIAPPDGGGGAGPGLPGGEGEDCSWYDIPCHINEWFQDLVIDALTPVLDLIADTTLTTPELAGMPEITQLWGITQGIANAAFVIFVVAGGAVVMSAETLQTRYAVKEILPRLVVGFLAVNASLALVGKAIELANALSTAVLGGTSPERVGQNIKTVILDQLEDAGIFIILVGLVVVVLAAVLLAIYVVRVAITVVLLVAAPLALACHASPYTDGVARLWWRGLFGMLLIQVLQSITMIVFVQVFFVQGTSVFEGVGGALMNLLISIVLIFILIKIPVWTYRQIGLPRGSIIGSLVKGALIAKGAHALLTGGRRRRGGGGSAGNSGWSPRPPRGGPSGPRSGGGPRGIRPDGSTPRGPAGVPRATPTDPTTLPPGTARTPESGPTFPAGGTAGKGQFEVAAVPISRTDVVRAAHDQAARAWSPPQPTVPPPAAEPNSHLTAGGTGLDRAVTRPAPRVLRPSTPAPVGAGSTDREGRLVRPAGHPPRPAATRPVPAKPSIPPTTTPRAADRRGPSPTGPVPPSRQGPSVGRRTHPAEVPSAGRGAVRFQAPPAPSDGAGAVRVASSGTRRHRSRNARRHPASDTPVSPSHVDAGERVPGGPPERGDESRRRRS